MIRQTTNLVGLADGLWDVEHHAHGGGFHLRTRMTVVRVPDGLWLHSVVPVDDELATALARLGPVAHIVAPNRFHHLHVAPVRERYPEAVLWAAPGLVEKRPDLRFDAVLSDDAGPWRGVLETVAIQGFPAINEVVFVHVPSRTLVCTDLLFNVCDEYHFPTRLLWRACGVWRTPGQNRFWRLMLRDRTAAAGSARRVLGHDFDRIVMAHGDVIENGGHALAGEALQWLLR